MKVLADIIKFHTHHQGSVMALATVVQTAGSSYRQPGARMLISQAGETTGSISGGYLERDVIIQARRVMESGKSILLTYDTTSEEDIIFGAGLGCKGVVHILVECLKPANNPQDNPVNLLRFIEDLFRRQEMGVIATVFRVEGQFEAQIGDRLIMDQHGNVVDDFPDAALKGKVLADARETLRNDCSAIHRHEWITGAVELLIEAIHSPTPLVLLGAGYDAIPMVRLAKELGFHVTVVDERPAYATTDRFPGADEVIVANAENVQDHVSLNERTAAVIMSHNYLRDLGFLKALLPVPLRYLGLMGPRKRAEKMLQELREEGCEVNDSQLCSLHNPVGLDIGAENPEQIALATLAEIQAVLSGHAGGRLREKKRPIIERSGDAGDGMKTKPSQAATEYGPCLTLIF